MVNAFMDWPYKLVQHHLMNATKSMSVLKNNFTKLKKVISPYLKIA